MRAMSWVVGVVLIGSLTAARAETPKHVDDDPPLWNAELRLGYGVARIPSMSADGETTKMGMKASPLSIAAIASWVIETDPPLQAYGGLLFETRDNASIGAVAGVELAAVGPVRAMVGGAYIAAPKSLWGAQASVGACKHHLCADVQVTEYFAGTDLTADAMGKKSAITQFQLVLGYQLGGR